MMCFRGILNLGKGELRREKIDVLSRPTEYYVPSSPGVLVLSNFRKPFDTFPGRTCIEGRNQVYFESERALAAAGWTMDTEELKLR